MLQKTRGLHYYFSLSFFLSDFVRLYLFWAHPVIVSFLFFDKYERHSVRMIKSKNGSQFASSPLLRSLPRFLFFFGSSSSSSYSTLVSGRLALYSKYSPSFLFSFLKTFFMTVKISRNFVSFNRDSSLVAQYVANYTLDITHKVLHRFIGLSFSKSLMHVARLSMFLMTCRYCIIIVRGNFAC